MPNALVLAAAIGLPLITPHSPAMLRGLRFIRPDGSYDLRAIFARARELASRWTADGRSEAIYGRPGRERWSFALIYAWQDAKSDRSTLRIRLDVRMEEARLNSLTGPERELAAIENEIVSYELSDGSSAYIARNVGPLIARAAAVRSAHSLAA